MRRAFRVKKTPADSSHAWLCRKVQGTMKWVGTTEAAALLRQFGIRARIVDFKGHRALRMPAHLMRTPMPVPTKATL